MTQARTLQGFSLVSLTPSHPRNKPPLPLGDTVDLPLAFLDLTLALNQMLALALVLLPVELWILAKIRPITKRVEQFLGSPDSRAEVIHEVALEIWAPFKNPEQRTQFLGELWDSMPLAKPEVREKLALELGHQVARVIDERAGSLKGVLIKQGKAALRDMALEDGDPMGLIGSLPSKIDLPIIGKVNPLQALQIAQGLRGAMKEGGLRSLVTQDAQGSSGGAGYPP